MNDLAEQPGFLVCQRMPSGSKVMMCRQPRLVSRALLEERKEKPKAQKREGDGRSDEEGVGRQPQAPVNWHLKSSTHTPSVPLSLSFENRVPLTIPLPERQTQWDGGSTIQRFKSNQPTIE